MDIHRAGHLTHGADHSSSTGHRAVPPARTRVVHGFHTTYDDDDPSMHHERSSRSPRGLCVDLPSRGRIHPVGIRPFERSPFVKFRIDRDTFADAVAWTARSLPNRPSVPVLAGLMIETSSDGLTLSGFDYETSTRATLPAEV